MLILNEKEIKELYSMRDAIQDISSMLETKEKGTIQNPHRTVLDIPKHEASALYMPSADLVGELSSVKIVSIFPDNPSQGKPTTQGVIVVSDGRNGEHLALMNASYLTRLRTGALSGIATKYLAKEESSVLTVIGTGAMAFEQVLAVLEVRDIKTILLVNRTKEKAHKFGEKMKSHGITIPFEVVEDTSSAVKRADIICCATRSNEPVFSGKDVQPGTHVNGVGSYLPHMREVDEFFVTHSNKIVVDDLEGIKNEAGELIHAHTSNKWTFDDIYAQLEDLVRDKKCRSSNDEITFFKSVGAAYFDLSVAKGVYKKAKEVGAGLEVEV
ncbi:ornithine cyclodeaminase family protein [Alkalihalobacillus sp. CinArs1]|uniref:ornithine cyclodeaminase family protein n=1 Tax=Alkalihalobacillus sp. CinArs1 TaxID=2995314 RepID=UPI0022DDCC90|nr:ornithine cyclodeaminase family protein [Alkalihalobacillus sp. CinArs1]